MLIYHYTNSKNIDSIKRNGLKFKNTIKNKDTILINEALMNTEHCNKLDRNNCLFLLPWKPNEKEENIVILELDTKMLNEDKLFVADFFYADSIWVKKNHSPHKSDSIAETVNWYWDSIYNFKHFNQIFNEEEEIELLYLDDISNTAITNIL
jgi:hypothetical protein